MLVREKCEQEAVPSRAVGVGTAGSAPGAAPARPGPRAAAPARTRRRSGPAGDTRPARSRPSTRSARSRSTADADCRSWPRRPAARPGRSPAPAGPDARSRGPPAAPAGSPGQLQSVQLTDRASTCVESVRDRPPALTSPCAASRSSGAFNASRTRASTREGPDQPDPDDTDLLNTLGCHTPRNPHRRTRPGHPAPLRHPTPAPPSPKQPASARVAWVVSAHGGKRSPRPGDPAQPGPWPRVAAPRGHG